MTQATATKKARWVYLSYHVIFEDGSSLRMRELDDDTMQSCIDGYCSVYRINRDELHELNLEGEWIPIECENEESVEKESANPAKSSTSSNLSDEERPD